MRDGKWLRRLKGTTFSARRAWRVVLSFVVCQLLLGTQQALAQYNIDRLVNIGRSALYYEDYVLSMQYFNQVIAVRPWLYEPWFFRAVAKYNLDDFAGAEADCTEAISRNPFVVNVYELRGLARIQQEKFQEAIADYDKALTYAPDNRSLWHNRVLCHLQNKDYQTALQQLDTMQARWSHYAQAYSIRADVYLQMADTTAAAEALEKSIELDPYDGRTWAVRSLISLQKQQWKEAEQQLDQAIRLLPKNGGYYLNRALARYHQNNLRGAMADYDMTLDLEPNNFLGHYNRGLLRADIGDDNRAIGDFDFVLRLQPDNMLALFNRAVLLDRTGDLRGAVRDYSKVIEEYPNFHTGILYRARCYRRLGMTAKAELDEFAVYKAQLYKHLYGIDPKDRKRSQRKWSDMDPDKFNELVVEDEQEPEREYQSEYRGHVQNRKADMEMLPMFALALEPQTNGVAKTANYDQQVESINQQHLARTLYINNSMPTLDTPHTTDYFAYIDSLTNAIEHAHNMQRTKPLLMARAVAYTALQDYEAATTDLTTCLQADSTCVPALWQRAVTRYRQMLVAGNSSLIVTSTTADASRHDEAQRVSMQLVAAGIDSDLERALKLNPRSTFLLYNRACLYAYQQDYEKAVNLFTDALQADTHLAEAYYNRGLCLLKLGRETEAVSDLSKAGELGLYAAYSIIKKQRSAAVQK